MALTETESTRAYFTRAGANLGKGGLTKPDIDAAIEAVNSVVAELLVTVNRVLPQPFKKVATNREKTELLGYVLQRRMGRARIKEDR